MFLRLQEKFEVDHYWEWKGGGENIVWQKWKQVAEARDGHDWRMTITTFVRFDNCRWIMPSYGRGRHSNFRCQIVGIGAMLKRLVKYRV